MIPVEAQGERLLCFRDPQGFNSGIVLMPVEALEIIRFFDGLHSVVDVQAEWMRQKGQFLFSDDIQRLVEQWDEHLLLDSPRFKIRKQQVEQEFISRPIRPMAHAGESYPADPVALRQRLDECFTAEGGAGLPERLASQNRIKGIIAPHIDLRVGGTCYSWAYKELVEHSTAETFIVLGTSHYGWGDLFIPTRKDYETPLGVLKTDQAFLTLLEENYGGSLAAVDTAHRIEHSIEFQAVFLHYLFHDHRPIQIVPILCTSFHDMVFKQCSPMEDPGVSQFVQALRQTVRQHEKTTCFVVGADLAHIGRKFGDPFAAQGILNYIEREDLEMLRAIESLDADGFFHSISQDDDQRKICGFPPIYTFLASVEATSGRLLKYEQWSEEATQSAVTYASLAFY
jgi:hypothetical protein